MNQNNNIIGYDPQTGQPIYDNQNNNVQQPTQNQISKKYKILLISIALLIIVGVIVFVLYFNNHDNKEQINNDNSNNLETENNNPIIDEQVNYSIGNVEEGTNTNYDENGALLISVEDSFNITGKGTVVTGVIQRGKIKVGDKVQIIGLSDEILTSEVFGIEQYNEELSEATIGQYVGIGLSDVERDQVQRGQVLAKPNSIIATKKFDANIQVLSSEEGNHTSFFNGSQLQFSFRTADITGTINLHDNIEKVNPGDNVSFTTTLVSNVAMEIGTEFSITKNGTVVGNGTVTKLY